MSAEDVEAMKRALVCGEPPAFLEKQDYVNSKSTMP